MRPNLSIARSSLKEIFNTYDEGGYIAWRLGPNYRDYIDGRALPFLGPEGIPASSLALDEHFA